MDIVGAICKDYVVNIYAVMISWRASPAARDPRHGNRVVDRARYGGFGVKSFKIKQLRISHGAPSQRRVRRV